MEKFVLQWHITHKCNLRCKHCYQDDYKNELSYENLKYFFTQFLDFLNEKKFYGHINFTGGEPFLSPYLFDLLDLCQENNISFGILTNGTLLDDNLCDKLSHYSKLSFIQVSIDGDEKIHDEIRGKGNYKLSFENLKKLRKRKIKTMISFTCHKENYMFVEDTIKNAIKNKVDIFWVDRLIPFGSNTEKIFDKDEFKSVLDILSKYSNKKNIFSKTEIRTNRALQWYCNNGSYYVCSAGKNLLALLADGTILPCRRLPIELGNLLNNNLINLYNNSKIIKDLKKNDIPKECKTCLKANLCEGGLKCLSYSLYGDYNKKDKDCFI